MADPNQRRGISQHLFRRCFNPIIPRLDYFELESCLSVHQATKFRTWHVALTFKSGEARRKVSIRKTYAVNPESMIRGPKCPGSSWNSSILYELAQYSSLRSFTTQ